MLINCPECGREVSDKSIACVYCGYPITPNATRDIITDTILNNIDKYTEQFLSNPNQYNRNPMGIYSDIKQHVNEFRKTSMNNNDRSIIEDKIAIKILETTMNFYSYCSWKTFKEFYSIVKFEMLSNEILESLCNEILTKISKIEYYSDGSSGNNDHILLWYPIHQLLKFGSSDIKEKLSDNLNRPDGSGHTRYNSVEKLVKEHLYDESILFSNKAETINVPKCPICQSTNLSKISATKKVAKIAAFGIFGMGDNGKTWKCNNCGSKF